MQNTSTVQPEIINRKELRRRLGGISEPKIIDLEKKGIIPSLPLGRTRRYNYPSVIQALEQYKLNNKK